MVFLGVCALLMASCRKSDYKDYEVPEYEPNGVEELS